MNFKLIAEGWTNDTETGQEPKDKGSFALPEMYGGSQPNAPAAAAKGGKEKAPPKGKDKGGAKGAAQADPN